MQGNAAPSTMLRGLALSFVCILAFGCASPATQLSENQGGAATASINSTAKTQHDKAKQLSQGKTVTLQTSQGTIEVAPTVVALADAPQHENTQAPNSTSTELYYYDPLEGFNRAMFSFNHQVYQYVLIPLADGYTAVVPAVARDKIGNVFDNLVEPLNLINNAVSGEWHNMSVNFSRFVINSTIGLLGLFDPASNWFDLPPAPKRLSQALADHNVEPGAFLVLPILGQSDVRGAFSTLTEGLIHPLNTALDAPEKYQLRIVDSVDTFSEQSERYQKLYLQAQDPYIYFRNLYIQGQRRDAAFPLQEQQDEQ